MNRSSHSGFEAAKCRDYLRLLGAYVDGELEPTQLLDVEGHASECIGCRERVELHRAMSASLKRRAKVSAPEGLRARALAAMQAEKVRGELRAPVQPQAGAWRSFVPLASAAALALAFGTLGRGATSDAASDSVHAGLGDELLQDLIAEHKNPVPSYDRTDEKGARELEQYVGVPVHASAFERSGAHFVGGRVMPVRGSERAAMLQYVIGSGDKAQRVSVFIYDPSKIQIRGTDLAPRSIGTAEVRVGRDQGYSVAVTQNDGIGYAVASDLDAEHSAELAAMSQDSQ